MAKKRPHEHACDLGLQEEIDGKPPWPSSEATDWSLQSTRDGVRLYVREDVPFAQKATLLIDREPAFVLNVLDWTNQIEAEKVWTPFCDKFYVVEELSHRMALTYVSCRDGQDWVLFRCTYLLPDDSLLLVFHSTMHEALPMVVNKSRSFLYTGGFKLQAAQGQTFVTALWKGNSYLNLAVPLGHLMRTFAKEVSPSISSTLSTTFESPLKPFRIIQALLNSDERTRFQPTLLAAVCLSQEETSQISQHSFKLELGPFILESSVKLLQSVRRASPTLLYLAETAVDEENGKLQPAKYELVVQLEEQEKKLTKVTASLSLDLLHWLPLEISETLRYDLVAGLLRQHAQNFVSYLASHPIPPPSMTPELPLAPVRSELVQVSVTQKVEDIIRSCAALLPRGSD